MSNNLSWYYNRLKAMPLEEVNHRVKRQINKIGYQIKYKKPSNIHNNKNRLSYRDIINRVELLISTPEDLPSIVTTKYKVFNEEVDLYKKISWHKSNYGSWNKEESSFNFTFANQDHIGDVRFTWEINRHQFFPMMAQQYISTKDKKVIEQLKFHFYDWISENPFLKGVNWSSPMEIAIRSYQWLLTLSILKDVEDEEIFLNDLLNSIVNSIQYVMKNLSLYSSANNHLIVEVAISSIVGYIVDPIYKQNWFISGYDMLNKQLNIQVHEDGVNKEQAIHYHTFVLEMILHYNSFMKKINRDSIHDEIVYKMAKFLGNLMVDGHISEFGDSDDAKIIHLEEVDYYKYVLILASEYFNKKFMNYNTTSLQVKSLYSRNIDIEKRLIQYNDLNVYNNGGYVVTKSKDFSFIFDSGPLGFGSIAAHGHADALNLVLYYKNNQIFVDSGTYIYNIKKYWRDYFRKTENHNTLTYNGQDQSQIEGPFLWSRKANSELIDAGKSDSIIYMKGSHDGFKPYIHERSITYLIDMDIIIITDTFSDSAHINYNFDSLVNINRIEDNCLLLNNELYLTTSSKIETIETSISKKFLSKETSTGIKINHNFRQADVHYTILSKVKTTINNDIFIKDNKRFKIIDYKTIREV
jgi:hypothetical protein